ncbi:quinate utilization oxidoreductase QutH [Aureobasidium namibiae CBS 147.97]|uniref:Quinate utilization oxidoreductase QutH n=1 Tax=Aureobasidium namibiae CBS 147.97 TaxID=1043004 RepID=A0A074W616_9PEZI|nr:quinate utilization oxidoreductase QutH [Aureobasidium namibiae CBS 147.97]KEQ68323.1 quinate utilization oxidoreductase QutH [Aureobasidium namibiae CBS 147.97]
MNNQPVTFAVIGTGLIGPRHAAAIIKTPKARLACIVDPNPAASAVAAELNVPLFDSVAEMLASPLKPQAAIICTPNHTHVSISKTLLDANVSVLCEKPIATDLAAAAGLLNHVKQSSAKFAVGHHRRFNRYFRATKAAMPSLGRVIAVSGLWTLYKPPPYFEGVGEWRKDGANGGAILINLVHDVDVLQFLLGPIVRVSAEETIKQRGFHAEEGAAILLKFQSGCVGTFIVSDAVPSPHNFESGTGENPTIPATGMDFYRIFGTEASLSVPDMKRWSYDGRDKSWTQELKEESLSVEGSKIPFELQVEQFVNVVRGEEEPMCSGEDAVRALIVVEAVKKAMKQGTAIDIPC